MTSHPDPDMSTLPPSLSSQPRGVAMGLCEICAAFERKFIAPVVIIEKQRFQSSEQLFMLAHHKTWRALKDSGINGCRLCVVLAAGFLRLYHSWRLQNDEQETEDESSVQLENFIETWYAENRSSKDEYYSCFRIEAGRHQGAYGRSVVEFNHGAFDHDTPAIFLISEDTGGVPSSDR